MRKFGFGHRALALLLVLIMAVQLLPLGVLADFGELQGADPGVVTTGDNAVGAGNSINWPIKVYDYLNDGMLFEWFDTNASGNIADSHHTIPYYTSSSSDTEINTQVAVPYAGGASAPLTQMGSDFTYDVRNNCNETQGSSTYKLGYTAWCSTIGTSWRNVDYNDTFLDTAYMYHFASPYYLWNSQSYGKCYTLTKVAATDYAEPMHAHITDGTNSSTSKNQNLNLAYFPVAQSTAGTARYMVLAYRSNNIDDPTSTVDGVRFAVSSGTLESSSPTLGTLTVESYDWTDSAGWTYTVVDMKDLFGTKNIKCVYIQFFNTNGSYAIKQNTGYLDLTHVGFFATKEEAENYGRTCVVFDNDPGEYLRKDVSSLTNTDTIVKTVDRSDYLDNLFSLNYHWYTEGGEPKLYPDTTASAYPHVRYGMDFTTHSTEAGWKTNAYTSDTFWTWSNGTTLRLQNTVGGQKQTDNFSMSRIGVDQMTQANGAQFVRLTTSGPSKILLSKFREDQQAWTEARVPTTADVEYMVLVYRPNGFTTTTNYGLWAHGYKDSSSTDNHMTASDWSYAGLTKNANWTEDPLVNQLTFSNTSQWQYVIIPVSETVGATDPNMADIDRLANLGLYLPTLSDGRSLDIAYVGYFKSTEQSEAATFGAAAVNYMNSSATVTSSTSTYGYGSTRGWYTGGNKSFGLHFASGGGQYWDATQVGSSSSATNEYTYGYNYYTWAIGYNTGHHTSYGINSKRYNLVWDESAGKYKLEAASYASASAGDAFNAATMKSDNGVYFIFPGTTRSNDGNTANGISFDTSSVPFDGYQLLQTIDSGIAVSGLLEGSLQTVTVDGVKYRVPVYREEAVTYIAYNLLHALRVPSKDSSGNYITQFIKGAESTQYGGADLNGDGIIGWIDYDGDSRSGHYDSNGTWVSATELNEESVDLATALRHELGMKFRLSNSVAAVNVNGAWNTSYDALYALMGNYDETLAKSQMLYGDFCDARNAIDTAMDAAYYLLNNLFISNSYNQEQDDYDYLTLSSATVNGGDYDGKQAYVFDAGFTTGSYAAAGSPITDDGTNASAVTYSPYGMTDAEGNVIGTGTISLQGVTGKTQFNYGTQTDSWTTRFPFLPITDAEGDYAGQTRSYYFLDDAQRIYTEGSNTYQNRNYNYTIASNGEFVYQEEDGLFFQFEGDDDVYLFINGELVLDIGGAHSITVVDIDINTYVAAAAAALQPLEAYGYEKHMSIDQFDNWIAAARDSGSIQVLDANYEPTGETKPWSYSAEQAAEFMRWHKLNLSDGQICQFDFYYMERHGWGANMRILTNMQINDPNITTEKKAYQNDNEIEYGGVIDPTAAVEYNFVLKNTGTTKLYNLTFEDQILGIKLDPTNGLTVDTELNGVNVLNKSGGYLQPKDLIAVVEGTDADDNPIEPITVTFAEQDGDGGKAALIKFLQKLESDDGTASGYDDAEITKAGSGLWVDASVTFKGMYYILTREQLKETKVENTVYVTATTRLDPTADGCRTLRDDAKHLLYTNGFPIHYQWAGHNIFVDMEHVLESAQTELENEDSQISLYDKFFKAVGTNVSEIYSQPCDKFGRVGKEDTSAYLTKKTNLNGRDGYLVHYDEPGIYVFYLLLYMKRGYDASGAWTTFGSSGVNASDIGDGYYAILRSQVYVADVEDSVYVLDYGLNSQSLDAGGELFKNDYLFGPYGTIRAKLMGVSGKEPTFSDPATNGAPLKTGVIFEAVNLEEDPQVDTDDGFFNVNLAIPDDGKNIAWDSIKGEYTLTGAGTVTVNAKVPEDWDTPYLYYWYDDGTTGPAYPGSPMAKTEVPNEYKLDIPGDVTNIIINNGSAGKGQQTNDLKITAGVETNVVVTVTETNGVKEVSAAVSTIIGEFTLHAKAEGWDNLYLYYWNDAQQANADWPGQPISEVKGYTVEDNGYISVTLPADTSYVILNNGGTDSATVEGVKDYKKTADVDIVNGQEVWVEAKTTPAADQTAEDLILRTETGTDGGITQVYGSVSRYSLDAEGTYDLHASVPASWGETIYVYAWNKVSGTKNHDWPGVKMTKGEYFWNAEISNEFESVIINTGNNGVQTVDLTVSPGLETWVLVDNVKTPEGKYTATINSGSMGASSGLNFTPRDFMDSEANKLWLLLTIHSTASDPTKVAATYAALNDSGAEKAIDIHNEVQMYKSITVLPATVVYYEDDFAGIQYHTGGDNQFTYYGEGSGLMAQSIDQEQVYGQDEIYQDSANNLYSGNHLTAVDINSGDAVATFAFTGTGFELISRADAVSGGTTVAKVYPATKNADGTYTKTAAAIDNVLVYNQFDHGNDGGNESVEQVPTIRVKDLTYGSYIVELSGIPSLVYCGGTVKTSIDQQGTCLLGQTGTRKCEKCNEDLGKYGIPATGHAYNTVVTEPTCTRDGFTVYTCGCGEAYAADRVVKLGHSYVDGVCTNCGEGSSSEEETTETAKTLYFKPSSNWKESSARFAAYFYGGIESNEWVDLTYQDGYYSCTVPNDGYTNVIFCRMNGGTTENNWDNKWNQTADLNVPVAAFDCLTLIEGVWDGDGGTWDNYTCLQSGHSYADGTCGRCGKASAAGSRTLYLKPHDNWKSGDARFAAYFYNDSGNVWVDLTSLGNGYYSCTAPEGYNTVIFCRMNPAFTDNQWSNDSEQRVWNQTGNLSLSDSYEVDCYALYTNYEDGNWGGEGVWMSYCCPSADSAHSNVSVVVTAPTCVATGLKATVCSACGYSTTEELATVDHNYVNGTCTVCGDVDASKCKHIYLDSACVYCGAAECAHTYTVTETHAQSCVDWGYTVETCSKCNDTRTTNLTECTGHSYKKQGTGSETKYVCETCGEVRLGKTHYAQVPDQTKTTRIYIDGIRIYQPLGSTNDAYIGSGENGAKYMELRDLILDGKAAVATLNSGYITVSSGTTTWSENLVGGDFDPEDTNSYVGSYVESADDYLMKGPNNEVYMEGAVSNSAIAFYVKETAGDNHELHIAARALDYAGFFGAGTSQMNVQLQLGIMVAGNQEWLNLTQIFSGTEQYYSIPYTRCPMVNGSYQIALRAVNSDTDAPALISYSSLKLVNMELAELNGIGQASVLEYFGGLLVKPTYYLLTGSQDANTDTELLDGMIFENGELTVTFDEETTVAIRRDMFRATAEKLVYKVKDTAKPTFLTTDGTNMLTVPAGEVTFKLVQTVDGSLTLTYCVHSWDESTGEDIVKATCTQTGIRLLSCTKDCGHTKEIVTEKDSTNHSYSGGKCIRCGAQEPKYYLNGAINGADYTGNDYLFVDGKLVATFDSASEIYLKDEKGEIYKAEADITEQSGIFFTGKDYTGTMTAPEKVVITFTLVVNADGSLSLSYTIPCAHAYDAGVVTKPATCTQPGILIRTCTKCDETYEEVISAGHKYDEVTRHCTVCGAADPETTRVIYFFNSGVANDNESTQWSVPTIYAWTASSTAVAGAWPGSAMKPVEGEEGLYYYAVPTAAAGLKFSDNGDSSKQTGNLTMPADGKNLYTYRGNAWNTYPAEREYALFGYINGANHAVDGGESSYVFVNGQLTVTFTNDSYVAVKTTDDAFWYMAGSYIDTSSGTMYRTSTGTREKMLVPAGTEVTFTLTENPDGSVSLSYTVDCTHQWGDGQVTTPAGCTTFGSQTFTCSQCSATKTEKINPTGHNFENGTCTNCQMSESDAGTLIYFQKPSDWNAPNLYSWDANNNGAQTSGGWPGTAMTQVDGDLYYAVLPAEATHVIFNDGSVQTVDLPRPVDGNLFACTGTQDGKHTGEWSTYEPAAAAVLLLEEETVVTDTPVYAVAAAEEAANMAALDSYVLNLESLKELLSTDKVYGVPDEGDVDTDLPDTEETEEPVIDLVGASLSFKDEIYYNIFFNVENPDAVEIEEMGLLTWTSEIDGTVHNAEYSTTTAVLTENGYKVRSQAIAAKNMGEELYFKVYLKLSDGSIVYSGLKHYSARTYATNLLDKDTTSDSMKALCVALMNYGAAAQTYFGHKTDDLMNAGLTAEQQALVEDYSADMLADVVTADVAKAMPLAANGGFASKVPSVNFGGALGINYNFTTSHAVDGDLKLYVWTEEQYNSVNQLTLDNASQVLTMKSVGSNAYAARVAGISAKNMEDTVYVCGVYESNGVTYRTGVLAYSVAAYMKSVAVNGAGNSQTMAQAGAVYGYYARVHLLGE